MIIAQESRKERSMLEDWRDYRRYIRSRQDIGAKGVKYYFFCCIPMVSNQFLEELPFEDWLPLIVSIASLLISIFTYCSVD